MYLILAICSMLAYSVQITLMAKYFRLFDPLVATAIRGLCLAVSMLPLLFLAESGTFVLIFDYPVLLFAAVATAALGNWSAAISFRYLPVGIACACQQAMLLLAVVAIGYFAFGEEVYWSTVLGLLLLFVANLLAVIRPGAERVQLEREAVLGLCCCLFFGLIMSASFSFVATLSREVDPFAASYAWEAFIGLFASVLVFVRLVYRRARPRPEGRETEDYRWKRILGEVDYQAVKGIFFASAPTAIGTGCFALAVTMGPFAIATAIGSTVAVAAAVLSYFIYGERLRTRQVVAILLVVVAIFIVKLAGVH